MSFSCVFSLIAYRHTDGFPCCLHGLPSLHGSNRAYAYSAQGGHPYNHFASPCRSVTDSPIGLSFICRVDRRRTEGNECSVDPTNIAKPPSIYCASFLIRRLDLVQRTDKFGLHGMFIFWPIETEGFTWQACFDAGP